MKARTHSSSSVQSWACQRPSERWYAQPLLGSVVCQSVYELEQPYSHCHAPLKLLYPSHALTFSSWSAALSCELTMHGSCSPSAWQCRSHPTKVDEMDWSWNRAAVGEGIGSGVGA